MHQLVEKQVSFKLELPIKIPLMKLERMVLTSEIAGGLVNRMNVFTPSTLKLEHGINSLVDRIKLFEP